VILDKPLPDPDDLNSAIPVGEWEKGVDGQPRPPWAHVVIVYGVDIAVGVPYTFISATTGAHIAFDHLMDAVYGMRMLRGDSVLPVVELGERPMKTKFGTKSRPSFNIVSWKEPIGSTAVEKVEPEPQQAALTQASEPVKAEATTSQPVKAEAATLAPTKAKRGLRTATGTLAGMVDVKPVTPEEGIAERIPW
jgi:hypothetical protein